MNITHTNRISAPQIIIHHSAFIIPTPPLNRHKKTGCTPTSSHSLVRANTLEDTIRTLGFAAPFAGAEEAVEQVLQSRLGRRGADALESHACGK
jgi:hypothetical protein